MSAQACIAAEPESLRCYSDPVARVAEQADAHGSGPCARKGVGVQLPPRARRYLPTDFPNWCPYVKDTS